MEVDRKFQQKNVLKKLVKSQEQSRAGLMQLLRWDDLNGQGENLPNESSRPKSSSILTGSKVRFI